MSKTVVITGVAGGIGQALAKKFPQMASPSWGLTSSKSVQSRFHITSVI